MLGILRTSNTTTPVGNSRKQSNVKSDWGFREKPVFVISDCDRLGVSGNVLFRLETKRYGSWSSCLQYAARPTCGVMSPNTPFALFVTPPVAEGGVAAIEMAGKRSHISFDRMKGSCMIGEFSTENG